jgi:hypothetical protein
MGALVGMWGEVRLIENKLKFIFVAVAAAFAAAVVGAVAATKSFFAK